MAPPTYDSAKHHIGLKERGTSTNYGFMLQGGYIKEGQREAGGAPEFGGATDLIGQAPSASRWTQDDFIGGMYAYNWGKDDAMFADCTGFIPSQQSRSLISCPPMYLKYAFDPDGKTNYVTDTPVAMFMVAGSIYTVWPNGIMRYQIDSGTMTEEYGTDISLASDGSQRIVAAEYDSNNQSIWLFTHYTAADASGFLVRVKTDLSLPAVATYPWPDNTATYNGYGMAIQDKNIVCAIGNRLYNWQMPMDLTDPAGLGTWTQIGRLPGRWRDYVAYNGMVYILCNDGSFKSQIVAYDGDSILPICSLPHSFYGKCVQEYAGRVFVGGTGTDINGGEHYAELYEITGASVRLVRSFSPETRNYFLGGVAGEWPNQIDDMTVFEGLLWFCQKGKRMVAYDVTSDGFFGAAEIMSNSDLNFPKLIAGRGRLWAWGVDDTTDGNHGIYRIVQPAETASVSGWRPTIITSDFCYEPAMKKRWGKFRVMSRYGSCSNIDYSTDGGATWTALTVTVSSSYGKIYYSDADLAAITPTEHIRFRIKLTSTGEAGDAITYHRELVAFTCSFVMLDTGKHAWSFTINGSEYVETRDAEFSEATVQAQDVGDVASTLWGYWDSRTPLTFTDVGGSTYDVQMVSFRENQPVIGPNPSGETRPEALYNVTLLEV